MAYFDLFPNVELPSFSNKRNSNNDTVVVKNLFKRGKVREDFFQNVTAFNKFRVIGDDRPDNVAFNVYGDEELDWVVLLSNNIICLLYTSPSPRDVEESRMPSSA